MQLGYLIPIQETSLVFGFMTVNPFQNQVIQPRAIVRELVAALHHGKARLTVAESRRLKLIRKILEGLRCKRVSMCRIRHLVMTGGTGNTDGHPSSRGEDTVK